jgi:hypothetical protein
MSRIQALLAYSWAALAGPLLLATFMGMKPLTEGLVAVTGLHVHPIYTGGEKTPPIPHGPYQTTIHRPVFDGLVGPRDHGFVQIQWQPADTNQPGLPELIEEPIDFDADGTTDFTVRLDTKTNEASLETSDRRVLSIQEVIPIRDARVVRVNLKAR